MNAAEFNALYEVGVPVFAYPGVRPEGDANAERLVTRTRSRAEVLGGHTDVVWVDGHGACIALSHVDVITEGEYLAAVVAAQGALPVPAGRVDHRSWEDPHDSPLHRAHKVPHDLEWPEPGDQR